MVGAGKRKPQKKGGRGQDSAPSENLSTYFTPYANGLSAWQGMMKFIVAEKQME